MQKRWYTFLNTPLGMVMFVLFVWSLVFEAMHLFSTLPLVHHTTVTTLSKFADNIGGLDMEYTLSYEPIDVVYTWVNGSDESWLKKKRHWQLARDNEARANQSQATVAANATLLYFANRTQLVGDTSGFNYTIIGVRNATSDAHAANNSTSNVSTTPNDSNRYRDSDELRYSIRSIVKNAPWIRRIFIVTDNQVPNWINLEDNIGRISIVTHEGR
jgi:UDP-N-acetylglucosamine-lysosomal-enzyme